MEKIMVRSNLQDGRVAYWERHPAHPQGEIFIATATPQMVAMTTGVEERIRSGILSVVETEQQPPQDDDKPSSGDDTPVTDPFDVAGATIDEVLAAVQEGKIAAGDALIAEQQGKERTTLMAELAKLVEAEQLPPQE